MAIFMEEGEMCQRCPLKPLSCGILKKGIPYKSFPLFWTASGLLWMHCLLVSRILVRRSWPKLVWCQEMSHDYQLPGCQCRMSCIMTCMQPIFTVMWHFNEICALAFVLPIFKFPICHQELGHSMLTFTLYLLCIKILHI